MNHNQQPLLAEYLLIPGTGIVSLTPTLERRGGGGINVIILLVGKLEQRNIKENVQRPPANQQQS